LNTGFDIQIQILVCIAIIGLTVASMWRRGTPSIGLPLSYLLSLSMIHLVGGYIHTLPWYQNGQTNYVNLGFEQYFYGMLAFAAGSLVAAPFVLSYFTTARAQVTEPREPNPRLPWIYIVAGLASFTVLAPILGGIPSVGAVTFSGVYLVVVGFCLGCWKAFHEGSSARLLLWLCLIGGLPVLTTLTLGFLGYGALSAMMVCVFLSSFFRPRWLTSVGILLMFFIGLSAYVTYMRERTALRTSMQEGAGYSERMEHMLAMMRQFEAVDFHNEEHLKVIDERINQNALVGFAVDHLSSGGVPYARGVTLWWAVISVVPRILWENKPIMAGGGNVASYFTGMTFAEGTSVGIGHVMEFYINFGTIGVVVGLFVLGVIARLLDFKAAQQLYTGNWSSFMAWFLPSISLLGTGGSLLEMTGSAAASIFLVLFLNRFLFPKLGIHAYQAASPEVKSAGNASPPVRRQRLWSSQAHRGHLR
jgi:hypothetical protein